ncbi:DUF5958 family protein [Streptomyces sp. DSM 40750]|uniref:DUF5958 family protein n=1 Tax=Streptomyces sp. DSM 40750 TaxID=2801030 RepID=UPI00214BBE96|nr:DUF5958 family protein [Streptomyces sp. DSM 40750]UUU28347.1 DUF5958 family protein [Streptomyces sp. DSM 40750]
MQQPVSALDRAGDNGHQVSHLRRSGLRPTHTPAVLISRGRTEQQLGKIAHLTSPDERRKAFRLLIAVLAIADERRRARFCSVGCGHWWHNLSATD